MAARPGAARRMDERLARRGGALELLRLPSALYAALVGARNALHDRGLLAREQVEVPVVSVGNLSAGGTGKTPCVIFLARELAARGFVPGILARGYRRRPGERGDEALLVARALPGVLHVENPDRVAGALALIERGASAILLDDGFQHRRLARQLDLVLVDATRPWGLPPPPEGGAPVRSVLPRGLLREPARGIARADVLLLTRCDQAREEELAGLEAELRSLAPQLPILRAAHRPVRLRGSQGELPLEALRGRAVVLVSGLGNPEAFERSARALGAQVLAVHRFPDHHAYARTELEPALRAGEILASAKDAVKLEQLDIPHLALEVELEILRGRAVLDALLDALPLGERAQERAALHAGLAG